MSKIKLATVWLDGCSGCHMSLLDADEDIAAIARRADLVYGPLVDAQEFPEQVDVTLVEGAVSSQDDAALLQVIRQRSRMVVALGDCAVTGNVPAMRNSLLPRTLLHAVYVDRASATPRIPSDGVPPLLKRAIPIHEMIKVDLHLPGCPPRASAILNVITQLLDGRKPDLGSQVRFG